MDQKNVSPTTFSTIVSHVFEYENGLPKDKFLSHNGEKFTLSTTRISKASNLTFNSIRPWNLATLQRHFYANNIIFSWSSELVTEATGGAKITFNFSTEEMLIGQIKFDRASECIYIFSKMFINYDQLEQICPKCFAVLSSKYKKVIDFVRKQTYVFEDECSKLDGIIIDHNSEFEIFDLFNKAICQVHHFIIEKCSTRNKSSNEK